MRAKKIFIVVIITLLICSTASANFFTKRFFEVRVGADAGFSNNLFSCEELLKKNLVIDLPKLAAECPKDGFNVTANATPDLTINLNIAAFSLGISSGVDVYEKLALERGLFEFLGNGNELGEPLDFGFRNDMDIFAYSQLNVGFKLGRLMVFASPAVFLPVVSVRDSGGIISVTNDSNGGIHLNMDMNMNVYSAFSIADRNGEINFTTDSITQALTSGYGFDLGGVIRIPVTRAISVDAEARIPLIPGELKRRTSFVSHYSYDADSIMTIADAKSDYTEPEFKNEEEVSLSVHRPLKAGAYLNQDLMGGLLSLRAGGGFAMQRPLSDSYFIYPEYYIGAGLNLIDMFKINVSTQYKDQVFIHQLGTTLNVRFIQVDVGASFQSADFIMSCQGSGFGAYAYVTVGF